MDSAARGTGCGAQLIAAVGHKIILQNIVDLALQEHTRRHPEPILLGRCDAQLVADLGVMIAPDNMRGRVLSVYNVAFRGGMPVGSLVVGALIAEFTAPVVLKWNGILLTILGLYFLFIQRKVATL